jgi:hypothetical protein
MLQAAARRRRVERVYRVVLAYHTLRCNLARCFECRRAVSYFWGNDPGFYQRGEGEKHASGSQGRVHSFEHFHLFSFAQDNP